MKVYLKHADLPFSGWEVFEDADGVQKDVFIQRYKTFEREQTDYYIQVDTLNELESLQSVLGEYFFLSFQDGVGYIKIYDGFRG